MTINQLTITRDELNQAVGEWLTKRGISVPVSKVDRDFSYSQEFQVEFKEPEPEPEPVAPFVPPPLPALTPVPPLPEITHEAD